MQKWLVFAVLTSAVFAQSAPRPYDAINRNLDGERLRAHVKFLSSDLLEGRGTGQRGGDVAGEYIATQFALAGLKPAGENGTYFQKVPLVGMTTLPDSKFTLVPAVGDPIPLRFKDEWVASNEQLTDRADVDAEIVFVGYGIEAPDRKSVV